MNVILMKLRDLAVVHGIYEGPGQKSPDYRASDAEGVLKRPIKIAYIR
jgi:hypothetical protein